ncbi:MAG: DNA alkylation repair protein [Verrucomicrobia bacterium]|nr:DNA alkylation repair protein [Verrucomicrobiota bacterium]
MINKPPLPAAVARTISASLRGLANAAKARSNQRFFKTPVALLGIETAMVRRLARDWQRRLKPQWTAADAVELCDLLMREREHELKGVGVLILSAFAAELDLALLPRVEGWLTRHCDNWALVDVLAPTLVSPLLARYPAAVRRCGSWTKSPSLWLRRAAVVAFVPHAGKGQLLDEAFRVVERLLSDREDFIHKALGWLLREVSKVAPEQVALFLLEKGTRVPRTTVRYALERFPPRERQRLLARTRE